MPSNRSRQGNPGGGSDGGGCGSGEGSLGGGELGGTGGAGGGHSGDGGFGSTFCGGFGGHAAHSISIVPSVSKVAAGTGGGGGAGCGKKAITLACNRINSWFVASSSSPYRPLPKSQSARTEAMSRPMPRLRFCRFRMVSAWGRSSCKGSSFSSLKLSSLSLLLVPLSSLPNAGKCWTTAILLMATA